MSTQISNSKDKSKPLTITQRNLIKCDLKEYEYKYFRDIIESQITENMIAEKRVKAIKKVFEEFTNDEIKEEYIIVIATDVSYYLQQKLNGLLLLLFDGVCIFIYKPKHLEIPKLLKMENIDREEFKDKLDTVMNKIKIVSHKGFETEQQLDALGRIQEHIALYYLKHQHEFGLKGSRFEEEFHIKLRNHMCIYSGTSYFHSFMGRKLDLLLSQDAQYNKFVEIELNFLGVFPNITCPYRLVIFNKRGTDPSVFDVAKFKFKEIFGFAAMLMIFLSLVVCRDYDPASEQHQPHIIRDGMCPHKQEMMGVSLTVFLSVMFQKMWQKYQQRRERKIQLLKKIKLEKVE